MLVEQQTEHGESWRRDLRKVKVEGIKMGEMEQTKTRRRDEAKNRSKNESKQKEQNKMGEWVKTSELEDDGGGDGTCRYA